MHSRSIFPNNIFGRIYSELYKFVDANIFISIAEQKNIQSINAQILKNKPMAIINNCASDILFKKKQPNEIETKIRVIFLGTIDKNRAPERIIELAKYTKRMNLPLVYYIFGNEGYKSKLRWKKEINYKTIQKLISPGLTQRLEINITKIT